ncbi:hypothetical protein M3Y98_01052100 [Aphelenchoides besseyi]|nr:hypothetical protein M3Y98_01052100 [Aphelenchoides besseyi]
MSHVESGLKRPIYETPSRRLSDFTTPVVACTPDKMPTRGPMKPVSKSTPRNTRRIQSANSNQLESRRRASSSSSSGVPNEKNENLTVHFHSHQKLRIGPPTSHQETTNEEKENRRTPPPSAKSLRFYHNELQEVCDSLLSFCRSQDLNELEDRTTADQMYKKHINELTSECSEIRNENSVLRHKLTLIDSRIAEVLSENSFLRWENEQNSNTLDETRRRLDEKILANRELQAEIRCLKANQSEINRIHANKLQDEVRSVRAEEKRNTERIVRELEHKLKEEQRICKRAQDECSYLKSQDVTPKTIDRLTEDNRELYRKLMATRRKFNEHMSVFYERESQLITQLQDLKTNGSPSSEIATTTVDGSETNVDHSTEPVKSGVRFGTVERISTDGQIFRQTIQEWEEKFLALRKEYEMEREQRKNVTKILLEMAKDMKMLTTRSKD